MATMFHGPNNPHSSPEVHGASNNTIADRVRNSQAYKTAYNIFSQLSDKSWLNRLIAIPTSVDDASSTWFDEIGLSNGYNDKQDANYMYCIQQIQNLIAEYYAWKNSLPISQVDQYQDAGINSAITGQGVSSSEMNPAMLQSDPSTLRSSNAFEQISSFVGAMTSLTGGFTDIVNAGVNLWKNIEDLSLRQNDFKLRQRQQLFGFASYLAERGVDLNNVISGDFDSMLDDFNESPYMQSKWSESSNNLAKETIKSGYLQSFDAYSKDIMQDLAQLSFDAYKTEYEYRKVSNEYNSKYYGILDPVTMAESTEESVRLAKELANLQFQSDTKSRQLYWGIVDKWKAKADDGSWLHQQMLSQLLTGYNPFNFGMNTAKTVFEPFKNHLEKGAEMVNKVL